MRQRQGVRPVRKRFGGIVVSLQKNSVNAGSNAGARQWLNELRLAAAGMALPAGKLYGMRHVKNYRVARPLQDRERAHIYNQVLVAERGAALRENDFFIPGALHLLHDVAHVPRRQKLRLLHIDNPAGLGRGDQQIGLPRQEGGNLQHVANFRRGSSLRRFMDVGEYGQFQFRLDFAENAQTFLQTRAAESFYRGAIGFVVGGFEDVGNSGIGGDLGNFFRHDPRVYFAFNHARARDQKKRIAAAEAQRTERDFFAGSHEEL